MITEAQLNIMERGASQEVEILCGEVRLYQRLIRQYADHVASHEGVSFLERQTGKRVEP